MLFCYLQVLQEASYNMPYMDCYYHRRDHSLMVVLHNPATDELYNKATWNTALHSDLGFRYVSPILLVCPGASPLSA